MGVCPSRARRQLPRPPLDPEQQLAAIARWAHLLAKLRKIRKLQRYYHNTGVHLQECCSKAIKLQLSRHFLPLEHGR